MVARPVAGDVAPHIRRGHPGLPAQARDHRLVDVASVEPPAPVGEKEIHALPRLAVHEFGLDRPCPFPGSDRAADQRIDGLGEGGPGLVHRNVEQAVLNPGNETSTLARSLIVEAHRRAAERHRPRRRRAGITDSP